MLGCRAYEGKRLAQKARGAGAKQGAETKKERKKKGACENKKDWARSEVMAKGSVSSLQLRPFG